MMLIGIQGDIATFPTCSVETREFIISGMCRNCQNDIFIEDDEEN